MSTMMSCGLRENRPEALPYDAGRTSPTLLGRVRDWQDDSAWLAFFERYHPLLHGWCARFGLDDDTANELCQRIWVELMARMRTFRYDPSRGFRGWLWRLFCSRAIDLLRQRRTTQLHLLETQTLEDSGRVFQEKNLPTKDAATEEEAEGLALRRLAERAQEAVRSRVDEQTWRAYWIIAIEDRPVREAADTVGKTYTAAYTGYKRVDRMLRAEGGRLLAGLVNTLPESSTIDRS
jgi:RNA polymerase sigma-70 factor (ECF subfamily)